MKIRIIVGIVAVAGVLVAANLAAPVRSVASENGQPVIVELFTSEGCSSCPPADRVLRELARTQPVAGAEVIALEEHVDYWNSRSWADPFSSTAYTGRENDYARNFRQDTIYTPEMVVDGKVGFIGSDYARAKSEIARSAVGAKASVKLALLPNDAATVRVTGIPTGAGRKLQVFLAVTQSDLESYPTGGENGGAALVHSAVVRSLTLIATIDPIKQREFEGVSALHISPSWKREKLMAVVFVQNARTGEIVGADSERI